MKITKNELKEMINESVERQLRKTKVNERSNIDYEYFPKSLRELKLIVKRQLKIYGDRCDLNIIDVSRITDMSDLFKNCQFNGDISEWDVSNVRDMNGMFYKSDFNGDISKWDVSNVVDMSFMFKLSKFNKNISKWFDKLNPNCDLKNFGIFNKFKIDSYDDFEIFYEQMN